MKALSAVVTLAVAATASARTFTVYNQCPFTIWWVTDILPLTVTTLTDGLSIGLLCVFLLSYAAFSRGTEFFGRSSPT